MLPGLRVGKFGDVGDSSQKLTRLGLAPLLQLYHGFICFVKYPNIRSQVTVSAQRKENFSKTSTFFAKLKGAEYVPYDIV
jgi:hypothetical protein